MTAAQESPPSTTLVAGKYQLLGLIGRGGMGSVWEGRHATLGTRVAIKFIEAEYANSADARSRFDNEARAAATIQSKHAIQIYDHGVTDDGKPYIVMEMLIGEPLEKRLERLRRLPLQDVARIIQQVSRALARAHEKGIIHRDLKPENIFLVRSEDDDDEIAKVLDFGIAKIKANPGEMGVSSSTKTGAVLGTPFYMSPEQARGLRTIDHRTDIWSLGVIAFKCATGKLPFDGESVGDLLVKICTAQIPLPSQYLQGLPPGFDAWFMRVMEREPERRFGSVQEMSDALAYAAGITMRQPNSGGAGSGPQGHMPQSQYGGAGQMQGQMPVQTSASAQGSSQPGTYRQTSNPAFGTGPQPALSGTQSPFTTSAHDAVPMKSNRGVVVASVIVALVVLGGAGTVAWWLNKNKTAHAGPVPTETTIATTASAPPVDVASKTPDPPKTDTTAVDSTPSAKPAPLKPGSGTSSGGGLASKPRQNATTPGTQVKPAQSQAAVVAPPVTPATIVRPPPKGKVEESGY